MAAAITRLHVFFQSQQQLTIMNTSEDVAVAITGPPYRHSLYDGSHINTTATKLRKTNHDPTKERHRSPPKPLLELVSVIARLTPLLVGSIAVVFLSIAVDLVHIVPALSARLVLMFLHVLAMALRPGPLVFWIFF